MLLQQLSLAKASCVADYACMKALGVIEFSYSNFGSILTVLEDDLKVVLRRPLLNDWGKLDWARSLEG